MRSVKKPKPDEPAQDVLSVALREVERERKAGKVVVSRFNSALPKPDEE